MKTVWSVMMGMALVSSALAQDAGQCPANPVVYPPFAHAWPVTGEALLQVHNEDSLGGIVRREDGKLILPMAYQDVEVCAERIIAQEGQSGLYGLFDLEGRELMPPRYAFMVCSLEGGLLNVGTAQDLFGVVDADGKVVVEPRYSAIHVFNEGMAGVEKDGRWGFINTEGKEVIAPQFDEVYLFVQGFAVVGKEGKYGLINTRGELVVPMTYGSLEVDESGKWLLARNEDNGLLLNTKGETLFTLKGVVIGYYPEVDLFMVVDADDKTYYVDVSGKEAFPAAGYDSVQGFSEGLAAVRVGEKWGYINAKGEMVITPQFIGDEGFVNDFSDGTALVFVEDKGFLIDHSGKAISKSYAQISETEGGDVVIMDGERVGLLGRDGRELLAPVYTEVVPFFEHKDRFLVKTADGVWQLRNDQGCVLAAQASGDTHAQASAQAGQCPATPRGLPAFANAGVYQAEGFTIETADSQQGMVSPQGKLWFEPRYVDVAALGDGMLLAERTEGGFVLMDTRSDEQVDVPYQAEVRKMQEGLLHVSKNDLNGFLDRTGATVVPLQFTSILPFAEGLAAVQQDGKWGYVNARGELALPMQYDAAYPFDGARAVVQEDGKWQIIDPQGQTVATLPYAHVLYLKEGYAAVFNGDAFAEDEKNAARWGVIDRDGQEILPLRYEEVGFPGYYTAKGEDTPVVREGMIAVKEKGLWGFVDVAGKEIVPPRYTSAYPFVHGLAVVDSGEGKEGLINLRGEEVVPPTYAWVGMEDQQTVADSGFVVLVTADDGYQVWAREKAALIEAVYANALPVGKGLLAVEAGQGTGWTLLNSAGEPLTSATYQQIGTFAQGLAAVQRDGQWGYIDESGKEVLTPQYEAATAFQEDHALVKQDGRWQLIDREGCVLAAQP